MKPKSIFSHCKIFLRMVILTWAVLNLASCKDDDAKPETVTDIDGNVYGTVTIGTQVWMAENLKVTKYRNGDPISNVTGEAQWSSLKTGAYCSYNNDANNLKTYGQLYNWYAVADSRNLAPAGWHIPTDEEWTTLVDFLGGDGEAGIKLKESGTIHWNSPNFGVTNDSKFTALPGGYRGNNGTFTGLGSNGNWWSFTEFVSVSTAAWWRRMSYSFGGVGRDVAFKESGYSVRCIKD